MSQLGVVVVDWRTIGVLESDAWQDRFTYAVDGLRQDHGRAISTAPSGIERIDTLFLAYPASLHIDVVEDKLLEKYLADVPYVVEYLYVCVCGRNPKGMRITRDDVSRMLTLQMGTGLNASCDRLSRPDDLDDAVQLHVTRRLKWNNMSYLQTEPSESALDPTMRSAVPTLYSPEDL